MKKLDRFKDALESELPLNSTINQVEKYLSEAGIEGSFVQEDLTYYAIVPNFGTYRIFYTTSLLIRVRFDESLKLVQVEYELEHSGL